MKPTILALGLLLVCVSVLSAREPTTPPEWAEKLFGPLANRTHDFGPVPRGVQSYHDFVITNVFAVPIEITGIRPPMGCTSAVAHKAKLHPGEKTTICISMDGRRFTGRKTQTVMVTFGPNHSTVWLRVSAEGLSDLTCDPGRLDFDSVTPGTAPSVTMTVEYAGPLDWNVSEVVVPKGAPFTAKLTELYRQPGRAGYKVKATLKKDIAPGPFHHTIFLKTNHPKLGLVAVPVVGYVGK
jgi:hypothetical protein